MKELVPFNREIVLTGRELLEFVLQGDIFPGFYAWAMQTGYHEDSYSARDMRDDMEVILEAARFEAGGS